MSDYYARRAQVYDRIYEKPERQGDLELLREWLVPQVAGRSVLDLACGTGYWGAHMFSECSRYCGVDATPEVLEIARKRLPEALFQVGDAYALSDLPFVPDTVVMGFWWSHVSLSRIREFMAGLTELVGSGGRILFFDNRFVKDSNTPITRTDEVGNTYQPRVLDDGSEYEVMKNFPSESQLCDACEDVGTVEYRELDYYWMCRVDIP